MALIDSHTLLAEIEALCQTQIVRISRQPMSASPLAGLEGQTPTNLDADAMPVSHAAGKRKPSLTELDQMPPARRYSRSRRERL